MILGLSITTYTLLHTVLSLLGIVAGLFVAGALASGTRLDRWAAVFVVTTVLANASGFGFPFGKRLPAHIVGAGSLMVLATVIVADYVKHLAGAWRATYAVGVVLATYLNVFVLVAQLFKRIPVLFVAAPTQSEPPFALTQAPVLLSSTRRHSGRSRSTGWRLPTVRSWLGWPWTARSSGWLMSRPSITTSVRSRWAVGRFGWSAPCRILTRCSRRHRRRLPETSPPCRKRTGALWAA